MKSNSCLCILLIPFLMTFSTGCGKNEDVGAHKLAVETSTNASAIETQNGANYLAQLHDAGRLLGEPTNYVGQLSSDIIPFPTNQLRYPVTRTFHLFRTNDPIIYNYTVTKPSDMAEWRLDRAWKSGTNNQVIEEWSVK